MISDKVLGLYSGLFCVLILVMMLVQHAWPLWVGETIFLRVEPVDPRDVFRGDYVILSYPANRLSIARGEELSGNMVSVEKIGDWWADSSDAPKRGAVLYVQIRAETSDDPGVPVRHTPYGLSDRPQPEAINLAGRVRWLSGNSVTLHYGLDAFFVEEDQGKTIEQAIRVGKPVFAEIAVTGSGDARVKDLIVDGQRVSPRD